VPKTLTMRLNDETYTTFLRAAKAERRSLANLIETSALRHIQESSFADDAEIVEILSDPDLLARLKAGSADAKRRRGRFVPHL
jgi:predicted transcriptional regulator